MAIKQYTPEQDDALSWMLENDGILLVHARPGAGKSFMAREIAEALQPKTALYTAFNKAIVTEGINRFKGLNVSCKTVHALAYSFVQPKGKLGDLGYTCIDERMPYKAKRAVIDAINDFFVSASSDMYEFMEEYFDDPKQLKLREVAVKYITKMLEGELDPTFNFMLKYFHLCLLDGSAECNYDLVILDEINDTTAVALEIFKLINAPKKLGLGETNQAIYDFLNLVDGFELLQGQATTLELTQSFRCSKAIVNDTRKLMSKYVIPGFKFEGTDEPVENGKTLYVTATNAAIIQQIQTFLRQGKGFHLLRKLSEIFAYPMAIVIAGSGKEVRQRAYKFLEEEYLEFKKIRKQGDTWIQHLNTTLDDQETKTAVQLLAGLARNNVNLFDLYNQAKDAPTDFDYTIATVFTSKGLEFENVYVCDDLNARIEKIISDGGIQNHDDLVAFRCYYVAVTRCGKNLINAKML